LAVVSTAGALAMGADPPPPAPPLPVPPVEHRVGRADPPLPAPPARNFGEAMAQMFPTPRLFAFSVTVNGRAAPGSKMCLGGAGMAQAMGPDLPRRAPGEARAGAPRTGLAGCATKNVRGAGGALHFEMTCDKAAGASASFRMVSDIAPGMREMRRHSESPADPALGRPAMVSDSRMVQLGDCPAGLKPGEVLMDDGTKVDAMARLSARRASAAKTSEAPKP
jgi:hypothetical protein